MNSSINYNNRKNPYRFDLSFDDISSPQSMKLISLAEIETLKIEAFQAGREDGKQEEKAKINTQIHQVLGEIQSSIARLEAVKDVFFKDLTKDTLLLLQSVISKISPSLVQAPFLKEIETVLYKIIKTHESKTTLCIKAHPAIIELLNQSLSLPQQSTLKFEKDPSFPLGMFEVQWEKGFLSRDIQSLTASIYQEIDQIIQAYHSDHSENL